MSLSVFQDPYDLSAMDLVQSLINFGFEPQQQQPNRYRHHFHRHRAHHYRRRGGRDIATLGSSILPLLSTLKEDDEKFTLLVDIPGLSKEQCSLRLENDVLTIMATPIELEAGQPQLETKEGTEPGVEGGGGGGGERIVWSERPIEPAIRKIPIPLGVDLSRIAATEKHGVLCVTMPKDPNFAANQERRIEVV